MKNISPDRICKGLNRIVGTLLPKVKMTCHLLTFVISSKQKDTSRPANFKAEQDDNHLDGKASTVDVVPQKKHPIVAQPQLIQYSYQIIKLPMDISDYHQWILQFKQIRFHFQINCRATKQIFCFLDNPFEDMLTQTTFSLEKVHQSLDIEDTLVVNLLKLEAGLERKGLYLHQPSAPTVQQAHLYLTRLQKAFSYYNSTSTSMSYSEIEVPTEIQITCSKCITTEELFKEAMGDIYSHRYFQHHQNQFAKMIFVIEIKKKERYWSIFKDDQQIKGFFTKYQIEQTLSQRVRTSLKTIESVAEEQQAKIIEQSLMEVTKANSDFLNQPFFESQREGVGRFIMRKKSGGRQKESTCCKFGGFFQRSKQRSLIIYLKGIGYYNEKGQIRQFLSFGHGFHFEIGKPSTGLQLGITIYANHRQLSLQARNIKDFIYFLFALRKVCKDSCYTSINRFNSFAPLRYLSSAKFFIDGQDYFGALLQALGNANKSILIMGWMLSPQFLLKREGYKISLEDVLKKADQKSVSIKIILYRESSFLSNGSQYTKEKLQRLKNVTVLCHPCGREAVLWSHNEKIVIIDEKQAFVGSLDICYGRYDKPTHQLFPPGELYPGLEYNNMRKNDQWDVKHPSELGLSRHECRLPWHDIAQNLKGDVVTDLTHHFYQMLNFVRFQNMTQPVEADDDAIEKDVKTIFSTKIIAGQESESEGGSGIFKALENRLNTIKLKGQDILKNVKSKIVGQEKRQSSRSMRLSAPQDYFHKYVREIAAEIQQKKEAYKSLGKKNNQNRNSGARSSRSSKYSVEEVKKVKQSVQEGSPKDQGLKKTNSFLLTGNKVIDFMAVEIDKDYIDCLEKVKNQMKPTQQDGQMKEIQSDEEKLFQSKLAFQDKSFAVGEGRDQCQIVRSTGNWSVGCHSSNTEFSIHIAYLQLISQAKHFIYIENQFFISSLANPKLVKNQVAQALYLRIRKAIQNNQRFKVFVVLPLLPGFSGDLEVEDCLLLRKQMQWQYDTICRGQNSLWQRLLSHTDDPSQYIRFLGLRNHGRLKKEWQPQTQIIYVHSKLVIVDDQIILCGSANINDRSLYGDRDSELAVITRGEDYTEGRLNGDPALVSQMAQELRIKLWMEHFGFTEQEAIDPTSDTTCSAIAQRAAKNTALYRKIFGCYPDDEITTRKMIEQKRKESNIQLYDELSPQIIGHVVQFPLRFLEEDSLTDLRTEKQFSVPTQCLT